MKTLNTSNMYPKFKIGDRVKHIIFHGTYGIITHRIKNVHGSDFGYTADWSPNEVELDDNAKVWVANDLGIPGMTVRNKMEMCDIMFYPEKLLELAY